MSLIPKNTRAELSGSGWAIILIGTALMLVFVAVLVRYLSITASPVLVLYIQAALIATMLIIPLALSRHSFDILEPNVIFSFWLMLLYVIRPLYIIADQTRGIWWKIRAIYINLDDIAYAQNITLLGVLGIVLGYYVFSVNHKPTLQSPIKQPSITIPNGTLFIYFLSAPISVILLYVALGPDQIVNYAGRVLQIMSGLGYLALGLNACLVAILLLSIKLADQGKRSIWIWLLSALVSGIYFVLGSRESLLILWIALWILENLTPTKVAQTGGNWRRYLALIFLLSITIAVLVVVPVIRTTSSAFYRFDAVQTRITNEVVPNFADTILLELVPFDFYVIKLAQLRATPELLYGESFVRTLLYVVPRSIWPDKPLPVGYELGLYLFGVETGTPITFIGELFYNFSWPGTFIGCLAFGWLLRNLYRWLKQNHINPYVRATYALIIADLFVILTRSLSTTLVNFIILIALIGGVYFSSLGQKQRHM